MRIDNNALTLKTKEASIRYVGSLPPHQLTHPLSFYQPWIYSIVQKTCLLAAMSSEQEKEKKASCRAKIMQMVWKTFFACVIIFNSEVPRQMAWRILMVTANAFQCCQLNFDCPLIYLLQSLCSFEFFDEMYWN